MANDIEIISKVNRLKNKLFYPRLHDAFRSTICFFRDDEKKLVAPAGSGLFLKIHDSYYVATAAHVIAEHYNKTFVILDDKELVLGGRLVSSELPISGSRDDDKIDISILKLDTTSAKGLLTRFKPIELSEIQTDHNLNETSTYFSVGYPLTRTEKIWQKNEIKSIGHSYQTVPNINFNFDKFGFSNKSTIALEYDQLVTNAKNPHPHYSPDLTGISGSGIWYFTGINLKHLVGVTIERVNEVDFKCLIATKIDVVVKMIEEMN
ncbi:MAG: hypothetical protein CMC96_05890 [Flavobacteriales bacterium]|nr:hypothetical protein [Flavobacteriales bacterium]|tara:strand:+ start:70 stop:861 length:792 start_codon:yes stop_codon:yes gene_type:complete